MPSAISGIAPIINQKMEDSVNDSALIEHPLRDYLSSKIDIYFFDMFAKIFLPEYIYALQNCVSK